MGIYYVTGNVIFPIQILVTKKLDGFKHSGLKILTKDANIEDIRRFLTEARLKKSPGDLANIDAVLQVSVSANEETYENVRRDKEMCQALKDLMKEEIQEEREETKKATNLMAIKKLMKNLKMTAEQAMESLEIPKKERSSYLTML